MKYLSFTGREKRLEWWIVSIVFLIFSYAYFKFFGSKLTASLVIMLLGLDPINVAKIALEGMDYWQSGMFLGGLIMYHVLMYIYVTTSVRRYHDLGKSGLWFLIVFVPFIGWLWQLIELGFFEGTQGDNQYGPALVSAPAAVSVSESIATEASQPSPEPVATGPVQAENPAAA